MFNEDEDAIAAIELLAEYNLEDEDVELKADDKAVGNNCKGNRIILVCDIVE
jgi:hypothetical protein